MDGRRKDKGKKKQVAQTRANAGRYGNRGGGQKRILSTRGHDEDEREEQPHVTVSTKEPRKEVVFDMDDKHEPDQEPESKPDKEDEKDQIEEIDWVEILNLDAPIVKKFWTDILEGR